MSDNYVNLQN